MARTVPDNVVNTYNNKKTSRNLEMGLISQVLGSAKSH